MKIRVIILSVLIFGISVLLIGCSEKPHLCSEITEEEDTSTVTVGLDKYGSPYRLGSVFLYYDNSTRKQTIVTDDIPIKVVNDFFLKKGYAPKVEYFYYDGYGGVESVYIGEGIDTTAMLDDLEDLPGVRGAYLDYFSSTSEILKKMYITTLPSDQEEWEPDRSGFAEVGRTEDGLLYEFGVVLVQYTAVAYDEHMINYGPVRSVVDFFSARGYTAREVDFFYGIGVTRTDEECVDPAPMLEGLKMIPGVVDVHLNVLYNSHEVLSGDYTLPVTPPQ